MPPTLPSKKQSSDDFEYALKETVEKFQELSVNVFVISDTPQQANEPVDAMRSGYLKIGYFSDESINSFSVPFEEHLKNQFYVNTIIKNSNANIIRFDNALCNQKICPLVKNGNFLYFDDDHLSVDGSLLLHKELSNQLTKLID